LLNVETFPWHANNGIGILLHAEKLDDFLDIGEFLCPWYTPWLAKKSREPQSLIVKG
jgi:hypothetical protein